MYYCYEKQTGKFAGSGTTPIENATYGSTEIAGESNLYFVNGKWGSRPIPQTQTDAAKYAIEAAKEFGESVILDFIVGNVTLGIESDGPSKTLEIMNATNQIIDALRLGSLNTALMLLSNFTAFDSKYLTEARVAAVKAKIEAYLNGN